MPRAIFLLTNPGLIKAYDFLSSLFIYDAKAIIAQLNGCLLNCCDWVSNILRVALTLAFRVMCHYALQKKKLVTGTFV